MSEEETPTPESDRYALEITGGLVHVLDLAGEAPVVVETWAATDMAALDRLAELNRRAAAGMAWPESEPLKILSQPKPEPAPLSERWARLGEDADKGWNGPLSPKRFLTHTLPAFAAEQRSAGLSRLLSEAREVETEAIKQIREFAGVLNRAIEVRQRIEDRIAALSEQTIDSHSSIS